MHKNISKQLRLNLEYDGNSTIYLSPLRNTDRYKFDTAIWWGARSVYKLKNENDQIKDTKKSEKTL